MTSTGGVWANALPATFGEGVQYASPDDEFESVSCVAAGHCTAVGWFRNAGGGYEAMTMTSTGGVWTSAVPALLLSSTDPDAEFNSVSCVAAGDCTAVGWFTNAGEDQNAMTMTSTGGVWANALPATFGDVVQSSSPYAEFYSVSCVSAGNCTAVGYFKNAGGGLEAMTMTSTGGVWANVRPAIFGEGVQSSSPNAEFESVSCVAAGHCTAVGRFRNAGGGSEAMTMTSTDGVWANAQPATFGDVVQNSTPFARFNSVSCVSAGHCTAVGYFKNAGGGYEAMTMTSTDGVWANAQLATFGEGVQNATPFAVFSSVSCVSAGHCTAVGYFKNAGGGREAMTMTSTGGVWANARPATFGEGVQYSSPYAVFNSLSCVSAGHCTAVGYFKNAGGGREAMTMTSTGGVWANVRPATFGDGVQSSSPEDEFYSVSCVSAGHCTAVGYFTNAGGDYEAMTMTSTGGVWANALPATFGDGVQSSSPEDEFESVSCVSAGHCTAVGWFMNAGGDYEAMTMTGFRAQEDAPESSVPESSVPESSVPESSVPESSVPSLATLLALPRAMLLDTPEVMVGSTIEVTVGGFTAGDTVRLVVASTPQVLGSGLADASGSVTLSGVIPIDLAPGDHTIAAIDAEGRGFRQTVTAFAVSLPATGGSGSLSIGVMLIALGVAMTIAVRLRRERVS